LSSRISMDQLPLYCCCALLGRLAVGKIRWSSFPLISSHLNVIDVCDSEIDSLNGMVRFLRAALNMCANFTLVGRGMNVHKTFYSCHHSELDAITYPAMALPDCSTFSYLLVQLIKLGVSLPKSHIMIRTILTRLC
jgi:hypothetical protein